MKVNTHQSIKLSALFCALIIAFASVNAQVVQTLRGSVTDEETGYPVSKGGVQLIQNGAFLRSVLLTDEGSFRFDSVPVGRYDLRFSAMGYQPMLMPNIEVTSGREVIMNVKMTSDMEVTMEEVEITDEKTGLPSNEMATVSAREFSVTETNLYAGSRGEPARMASNYAGVQGADDSRNDIVIRGNSPAGVLWRLEGINIPNPNHFSIPGTGGGPVTILNNKFLANSGFYTGAFPSEYGNGTAGVFDLQMRNGNNEKHEVSAQIGFLGTEAMAEGPLSRKSGSSYLATFRYSTLQLFSFMGINVGTDAIPRYMDGSFRLNFPLKNGAKLAIWGIGGNSDVDIILSTQEAPDTSTLIYGSNDRDQYFGSTMGTTAISYTHPVSMNTLLQASVAVSHQSVVAHHDQIFRHVTNDLFVLDSLPPILDYTFRENKYSSFFSITHRIGQKHTVKAGINADLWDMKYLDSVRTVLTDSAGTANGLSAWNVRWDASRDAMLIQPYVQYKFKPSSKMSLTAGITSLYWSLNPNSFSPVEPRIGINYAVRSNVRLNAGAGLHSQIQSSYLYFYGDTTISGDPREDNVNMGLTKSAHAVAGVDWLPVKSLRLRAEVYYQYLFGIPVRTVSSSFSLVNSGAGFSRFFPDSLTNEGTGRNIGAELTIEHYFTKGYYFLLTGSLFDARYEGSDGVLRNTTFNGKLAANFVFAKEFTVKKKNALQLGTKITYAGGRWYGPVDDAASSQALEVIYVDSTVNSQQFRPYFRADFKVLYRWNRPKVTHEFALDLVNLFGIKNILTLTYAPNHPSGNPIREEYQLGFLPLFYYKIDF